MKQKTLTIDIETSPVLGYVYNVWEGPMFKIIEDWFIFSVAWKWLDKAGVKASAQIDSPDYHKDRTNDKNVVLEIWKLLDEADIVIGHNARGFDVKKINSRFFHYGLNPPSPYKIVDTLTISRSTFAHTSNKLDSLSKVKGRDGKIETKKELWLRCRQGDEKAWKEMIAYNKKDIIETEELYKDYLPWIKNHPYIGNDRDECPNCGSPDRQKRGLEARTNGKIYQRYSCLECGANYYGERIKEKTTNAT